MSGRVQTLTWDNMPHSLELFENEIGRLYARLTVRKPNGTQLLTIDEFPDDVRFDDILRAWERQGSQWRDLFRPFDDGCRFAVVRVIDIGRYRLLWHVLHEKSCPQDALQILLKPKDVAL